MGYLLNDAKRVVGRIASPSANNYTIHATIEEKSTDISSNTSSLYYKVWLTADNDKYVTDIDGNTKYMSGWAFDNGNITAYININGSSFASAQNPNFSMGYPGYGYSYPSEVTILEGTKSITHNADGTLSAAITVGITNNNNYGATPSSGSMSKTVSLTTIPRASSISATNCTIGGSVTFTIGAASSSFTHKIEVYLGSTKVKTISSAPWSWTPGDISGYIASNLSYIDATYYLYTYSGGTHIGTKSTTSRISMPGVNTAANWSGTINSSKRISWTQNLASYETTVQCFFGNKSETLVTRTKTTYKDWTPPFAWSDQIPSKMSGDGTLRIITYANSSSGYRQLGYVDYKLTLNIPDYKPTVSFTSVVPVSDNSIVNGWGVYVKGYSKCRYVASASGNYNSSISSASFTFAGQTASGLSNTTGVIGSVGTFTARITVTDSRGKTNYADFSAKVVYDYGAPVIVSSYAYRSDDSGAKKDDSEKCAIFINAKTDYSCGGKNTISTRLRARVSNGSWGSWYTMTNNQRMIAEGYGLTISYQIELQVYDSLGGTKSVTYTIPTASVAFNIKEGGKGAAFFGYAQQDGALTINGLLDVFGKQMIGGQASQMIVRSSDRNYPQAGIAVQLTDTENLFLLYGTSRNRGLYDGTNSKWMAYTDGYHTFIPGKLIEVSKFVEATTSFAYHGTSITIPANHGALIVGGRNWNSNMPVEVGLSSSSTSFSGYGGAYASGSPTARPNHVLWCIALLGVSPSARTVYLWSSASHTGNSTEYLHAYLME